MYRSILIGVKLTRDEFNDMLRKHRVSASDALQFLAQKKIEIESYPGETGILIGRKQFSGKAEYLTIRPERWASFNLENIMQEVSRNLAKIGIEGKELMVFIT